MNLAHRVRKLEDEIGEVVVSLRYLYVLCDCKRYQGGSCKRIEKSKRVSVPEGVKVKYVFAAEASTEPNPCTDCMDYERKEYTDESQRQN